MKRIAFLGSANAMKPRIIIETLLDMNTLQDKEIIFFTEKKEGICYEFCKEKNIKTVIFPNIKLDDEMSINLATNQWADLLVSAGWPYKIPSRFLNLFK